MNENKKSKLSMVSVVLALFSFFGGIALIGLFVLGTNLREKLLIIGFYVALAILRACVTASNYIEKQLKGEE